MGNCGRSVETHPSEEEKASGDKFVSSIAGPLQISQGNAPVSQSSGSLKGDAVLKAEAMLGSADSQPFLRSRQSHGCQRDRRAAAPRDRGGFPR